MWPDAHSTFRRSGCIAALFLGLSASGVAHLAAMPQDASGKVTSVNVGFDMGKAGLTVSLPIELTAPDGIRVGTTVNDIAFPAKWLKFEEVRGGPSAEGEVTASVTPDAKNTDNAILHITVTAKQGLALSNGIVAFVVFKVSNDAPGPQVFKLANAARALGTDVPPSPIEPVTGKDGQIELFDAPPAVVTCFFYMH